jgi:hypothetical protein
LILLVTDAFYVSDVGLAATSFDRQIRLWPAIVRVNLKTSFSGEPADVFCWLTA